MPASKVKNLSKASTFEDMDFRASVHIDFGMVFFLGKRYCSVSYVTNNLIDNFAKG